jgi:hypothetical protein
MTRPPRLHLIINAPEPGEWFDRQDVTEALEAAGWTGEPGLLRKNGAVWALSNEANDSFLSVGGWTVEFPGDTPTVVVVAACLAAAAAPVS